MADASGTTGETPASKRGASLQRPARQSVNADVAQELPPEPEPSPGVGAQPTAPRSRLGRLRDHLGAFRGRYGHRILAIGWAVTTAALLLSLLMVWSANRTLDEDRAALSSARAAASAADARVAAFTSCIAAMRADQSSLASLNSQIMTSWSRTLAEGDIGTTREGYESALRTATVDFHEGSIALDNAAIAGDGTAFNAAVLVLQKATAEMHQAEALKATLDSLLSGYQAAAEAFNSAAAALASQMAATAASCGAATA